MELREISTPAEYPDAYWAAGDEAYQLLEPLGPKRISRLRANINHNLLLQRRLFLADTSILVSPSMFALLRDEQYGAGYQQLFRDGLIVAAMRPAVNNYSELAELVIEKRHFVAEMDEEMVRESARLLDSLHPQIVRTDTREGMRKIGRRYLLQPSYWFNLGISEEIAVGLTESVSEKIQDRGLETVRQSEFWEYARDELAGPDQARQAQHIRSYMTIASLGTMAKSLGIPPIFPAAYGQNVDQLYGTRTPWRHRPSDGRMELLEPFESKSPRRLDEERNIHEIAAILSAEEICAIRGRAEYNKFLKEVRRCGQVQDDPSVAFRLDRALQEFRDYMEVSSGEFITEWEHRASWLWETKRGQFARLPIPGAVGTIAARVDEFSHAIPDKLHLLGYGTGLTVGAALTLCSLVKTKKSKGRKEDFKEASWEERQDPTVIPELRSGGCIEMSLFGTIPYSFAVGGNPSEA